MNYDCANFAAKLTKRTAIVQILQNLSSPKTDTSLKKRTRSSEAVFSEITKVKQRTKCHSSLLE